MSSLPCDHREILVCATFREFDAGMNDAIQREFLQSLKRQTYQNFRLIVTNFREKHVEEALRRSGLPFVLHQSEQPCRLSFTEVVRNTFPHLEKGKHIIFWTNADNIFEENLFNEIVSHFRPGVGGTSYPPIHHNSLEEFRTGKLWDILNDRHLRSIYQMDPNRWVPECDYVDGDIFLMEENRRPFSIHEFGEGAPGQTVTLVFAFPAKKLQNLFYQSKVHTIKNAWREERMVDTASGRKQMENLIAHCLENGIPGKYIPKRHPLAKWHQHRRYRVVGRVDQKLSYALYMSLWFIRHAPALFLWYAKKFLRSCLRAESVLNSKYVFRFVQRILNTHYMNEALKHWLQRHPYHCIKAIRRHEDVHARLGAVQRYPERIRSFGDLTFLFHFSQANFGICLLELDEAAYLHDLVSSLGAGRRIAEIGRFKGGSTFLMASAMGEGTVLHSFDLLMHSSFYTGFREAIAVDPKEFDAELREALLRYNLADRVNILVQDSTTVELAPESYDLVFVDGDHSYEGAKKDFLHWKEAMKRGGHMLFHDAANTRPLTRCKQGVVTLMSEIEEHHADQFEKVAVVGSLVHFRQITEA